MTSHRGEGIHGEGYDHGDRFGKASLPSACGVEGRRAGIAQMGQRGIRRLLILGAMAVVRWAARKARAKNIESQRWRRPDRQALTLMRRR
jgi:hypothetical protein